jgi:hypothetical protein
MAKPNKSKTRRIANGQASPAHDAISTGLPHPQWRVHLDSYRDKQILTFPSTKDLEAAIDLLWSDALRELPHDTADGKTLIVPAEAMPYFSHAGIPFTASKLRSLRDLHPEEIAKVRQNRSAT